ncbi:hypothetical protein OG689_11375 [Kitasatospora sp. NBC_00240]|uniref:hypothetical protein n=1 Tax=Kitasatospora sp. NBC_00240 TaxID=2903567 RepID=UPI0022521866|nr:hypothetical protein [Kitasatospora sp. NBC_00240]MCX5209885.1 hypothetical protein [Kitasatospora sp. NBC_00240]
MTEEDGAGGEPPEPEGGEAACWLNRVCPECDAVLDRVPPVVCHRCGAEVRAGWPGEE